MSMAAMTRSRPWYRGLDANQWKTMIASNIGWMFDGYETYALILTVGVALHQLLDPSQPGRSRPLPEPLSASRCLAGASAASSAAFSQTISVAVAPLLPETKGKPLPT